MRLNLVNVVKEWPLIISLFIQWCMKEEIFAVIISFHCLGNKIDFKGNMCCFSLSYLYKNNFSFFGTNSLQCWLISHPMEIILIFHNILHTFTFFQYHISRKIILCKPLKGWGGLNLSSVPLELGGFKNRILRHFQNLHSILTFPTHSIFTGYYRGVSGYHKTGKFRA